MDQPSVARPRVFISYSHEPESDRARVRSLADALRNPGGVDAWIDQYVGAPAEGWNKWMEGELGRADFVLILCTPSYRARWDAESGGVVYEVTLIQNALSLRGNRKFVPVLFDGGSANDIPLILRGYQYYQYPSGWESLLRRLWNEPEVTAPDIGPQPSFVSPFGTDAGMQGAPVALAGVAVSTIEPSEPGPAATDIPVEGEPPAIGPRPTFPITELKHIRPQESQQVGSQEGAPVAGNAWIPTRVRWMASAVGVAVLIIVTLLAYGRSPSSARGPSLASPSLNPEPPRREEVKSAEVEPPVVKSDPPKGQAEKPQLPVKPPAPARDDGNHATDSAMKQQTGGAAAIRDPLAGGPAPSRRVAILVHYIWNGTTQGVRPQLDLPEQLKTRQCNERPERISPAPAGLQQIEVEIECEVLVSTSGAGILRVSLPSTSTDEQDVFVVVGIGPADSDSLLAYRIGWVRRNEPKEVRVRW